MTGAAPPAADEPALPSTAGDAGALPSLALLEAEACRRRLLLRLRLGHPLGLWWSLQVAVARPRAAAPGTAAADSLQLLGELRGWALPTPGGLRLDTMRVRDGEGLGVGWLIWAATFAWSLEATPCRSATLLAIDDEERQHRRLVRYFRQLGFRPLRPLGAGAADLAPRLLWGGAGLLMRGDCRIGLQRSARRLGMIGG